MPLFSSTDASHMQQQEQDVGRIARLASCLTYGGQRKHCLLNEHHTPELITENSTSRPSVLATSSSVAETTTSLATSAATMEVATTGTVAFLPDYTEHPKPKKRRSVVQAPPEPKQSSPDEEDVTFFHDFCAGGVAGSASVIVGHPFDTIKVRIQASTASSVGISSMIKEFGGVSSLFRGMGAPLSAAAVINAIVFGSYGVASRFYDENITVPVDSEQDDDDGPSHDPWQKAMACGSFAGLVQCAVICPMEHVKCRLQVQQGNSAAGNHFKGPISAFKHIVQEYGVRRLYQGWWVTCAREVPAFGLYFSVYDYLKDKCNSYLSAREHPTDSRIYHSHTWLSSALAGGSAGALTWGIVYPVDIVKTHIQTMPLNSSSSELSMFRVGSSLAAKYGWRHLFRGMGITLVRAFPVNGTIFPIYEFTLMRVVEWEKGRQN